MFRTGNSVEIVLIFYPLNQNQNTVELDAGLEPNPHYNVCEPKLTFCL